MGFLKNFVGLFKRSGSSEEQDSPKAEGATGSLRSGASWRDLIDIALTPALCVSTVYRCVQLLSDSVAVLPLLYRRLRNGVFVTDTGNALSYLFNVQPDPAMSAYDFKRQIVIELLMEGNAYIVPFYSPEQGCYTRLALCTRHTVSYDTVTDTYSISDSENGIFGVFDEADVIHIKGMPGPQPKRGVSVLTHARQSINVATAGSRETLNRFVTGGDVRGIVSNGKDTRGFGEYQDEELARVTDELEMLTREMGRKILPMPGQVSWTPISMTSADMQFLESRKFTVREICRFFGVHPSFVFDDTSNNYKSAEMANVAFLSNTLNPLLVKVENEFLRKLFPASLAMKRKVTFDRRELYACDLQSKVAYVSKILGTGWTVNEVRAMDDLPPVEGGDTPLVSANLKSLVQLLTEQGAGAPEENDTDNSEKEEQNEKD